MLRRIYRSHSIINWQRSSRQVQQRAGHPAKSDRTAIVIGIVSIRYRSARGCHPCLRYVPLPMSPGWTSLSLAEGEELGSNILQPDWNAARSGRLPRGYVLAVAPLGTRASSDA